MERNVLWIKNKVNDITSKYIAQLRKREKCDNLKKNINVISTVTFARKNYFIASALN